MPGFLVPDGQVIDAEKYFEMCQKNQALIEGSTNPEVTAKELGKIDQSKDAFVTQISGTIEAWLDNKPFVISDYPDACEEAEELEGTNTVGVDLPKYLNQDKGSKIF